MEWFFRDFGISQFEILIIENRPNYWKNYVVFIVGVVEVAVGLLVSLKMGVATGNLKMVEFGIFLVRQGLNDIFLAFDSAINGKEIDLKKWLGEKAISYTGALLNLALGPKVIGVKSEIFGLVKKTLIKTVSRYAIKKSVEYGYKKILSVGLNTFQTYC